LEACSAAAGIIKSAIVESGVKPPHSKARMARETAVTLPIISQSRFSLD